MQLLVYYQKHFTEVPNEWRDSQISNECGGIFKISWIWRKFWINMSKFSQVILFFERIVVFWWYSSNRIWFRKSSVEAHVTPKRERERERQHSHCDGLNTTNPDLEQFIFKSIHYVTSIYSHSHYSAYWHTWFGPHTWWVSSFKKINQAKPK